MKEINFGEVVTIVGRYYAMDRDKRWERIQVAVDALVKGKGEKTDDPVKLVQQRYEQGETDEFLKVSMSACYTAHAGWVVCTNIK
jgi:2,3-bisphosphoglycerate-independent phosphoglycerate mutase